MVSMIKKCEREQLPVQDISRKSGLHDVCTIEAINAVNTICPILAAQNPVA